MFVAIIAFTNLDPGMLVMIVLVVPLALIVALVLAARVFARQTDETVAEGEP